MTIAKNRVVTIDYTLTDEGGAVLDTSQGEEPLAYIHGTGTLVPGLETALEGKAASAHVSVTVSPDQGYGARDESVIFTIPRGEFEDVQDLTVGMRLELHGEHEEPLLVTVITMDQEEVTVDANHPLAGQTLHFEVDVRGVREATAEELAHGHAHDGHHGH